MTISQRFNLLVITLYYGGQQCNIRHVSCKNNGLFQELIYAWRDLQSNTCLQSIQLWSFAYIWSLFFGVIGPFMRAKHSFPKRYYKLPQGKLLYKHTACQSWVRRKFIQIPKVIFLIKFTYSLMKSYQIIPQVT